MLIKKVAFWQRKILLFLSIFNFEHQGHPLQISSIYISAGKEEESTMITLTDKDDDGSGKKDNVPEADEADSDEVRS